MVDCLEWVISLTTANRYTQITHMPFKPLLRGLESIISYQGILGYMFTNIIDL